MQCLYMAGTITKCLPEGGVCLWEVSVSGGSAVFRFSRCAPD